MSAPRGGAGAATPGGRSRSTLPILFSVVVVDLVGFGIVVPILPFYAHAYGASATELGLLLMVYAAAQFACAPLWGRLSDRVGRRPTMLLTISGTALSLLALALAPSLAWVFAARALAGGFAANVSVASAIIADVTAEDERTRFMGLLGASFGVGFLLGPALGGGLALLGNRAPLLAAAGLAAANGVHAALSLREPPRRAERAEAGPGRVGVLREPVVRRICLANLVFALAVTQLETVFPYYMLDRFGYGAPGVAVLLVLMALVMIAIQGGAMRRLATRFTERSLVVTGTALLAVAFALVPLLPLVAALAGALAVAAVGRAISQPSLLSLASVAASPGARGVVLGTFQSSASLARVVGPVAAGWLYDHSQGAPFLLASALAAALALGSRLLPARAAAEAGGPSPAPAP